MNNDLISRSALKIAFSDMYRKDYEKWIKEIIDNAPTVDTTCPNCDSGYAQGYSDGYLKGKDERPQGEWIPIKYRPLTVAERIAFAAYYGVQYCDTADEKAFDCPMPEDKQEILISTSWGVVEDVADNDIDFEGLTSYGLEGKGDWDGVDAWMPKPEPYKKGGKDND